MIFFSIFLDVSFFLFVCSVYLLAVLNFPSLFYTSVKLSKPTIVDQWTRSVVRSIEDDLREGFPVPHDNFLKLV